VSRAAYRTIRVAADEQRQFGLAALRIELDIFKSVVAALVRCAAIGEQPPKRFQAFINKLRA